MHELSLAESVLQIVEEHVQECRCVKAIHLEIGEHAGVDRDALKFCLELVCANSIAEGAAIEIAEVAGMAMRVVALEVI
ncbi:MAG: hydrogenase maturation nickel metallochaperone HypA [Burkholderiales bacterium]|nr:hydrogenase maturation nickel metallochaperone HypA [Burkholderiales bacterium]